MCILCSIVNKLYQMNWRAVAQYKQRSCDYWQQYFLPCGYMEAVRTNLLSGTRYCGHKNTRRITKYGSTYYSYGDWRGA